MRLRRVPSTTSPGSRLLYSILDVIASLIYLALYSALTIGAFLLAGRLAANAWRRRGPLDVLFGVVAPVPLFLISAMALYGVFLSIVAVHRQRRPRVRRPRAGRGAGRAGVG
jgi:hypothetical protein